MNLLVLRVSASSAVPVASIPPPSSENWEHSEHYLVFFLYGIDGTTLEREIRRVYQDDDRSILCLANDCRRRVQLRQEKKKAPSKKR